MKQASLLGRDHHAIGEFALECDGASAIALSRGGAPKRYEFVDPNEDAVAMAHGPAGVLLAVADGHHGAPCAALAVAHVTEEAASKLLAADPPAGVRTAEDWQRALFHVLAEADRIVERANQSESTPVGETTLSLALVRADVGLVHASVGDSHVFVVEARSAADVGWQSLGRKRCDFIGSGAIARDANARANAAVGLLPLGGVRAVVLATDGLSEAGIGVVSPSGTVAQCAATTLESDTLPAAMRAAGLCRGVLDAGLRAQRDQSAGDNIAVAALLL